MTHPLTRRTSPPRHPCHSLSDEITVLAGKAFAVSCGGQGPCTIDAGGRSRAFKVPDGARLTLSDVTLTGGLGMQGGAVLAVGA